MKRRWKPVALVGLLALLSATALQRQTACSSTTGESGEVAAVAEFAVAASVPRPIAAAVPPHLDAPDGVSFRITTLTIPTYPYTHCLQLRYNGPYPYRRLDWGCYGNPSTHVGRTYELLVLENDYLYVTLLPELGGRIYQMIFKPTGHNELYQNPVIKPTRWGPPEQGWWLAVGGVEWCLPVEEHGYEWGEPWDYRVITSTSGVTVTLRDTITSDRIRTAVTVHLPADRGYLAITPRIENPTDSDVDYKYWINGMLAPGAANTVGEDLRFVFDAGEMSVHSTGDSRLPGHDTAPTGPDHLFSWPIHDGTDFSRLGNWREWLGFFEYPQAMADFVGVYDTDPTVDEGLARVFPSGTARGSKGFGFGWSNPVDSNNWTDDGSTYVELHGGVAPTFWDTATIAAGQSLEWTEYWYPVGGIGQLSAATVEAALGVRESDGYFHIGVHSTVSRAAGASALYIWNHDDCTALARWELPDIGPGNPFTASVVKGGALDETAFVYLSLDDEGHPLAALNPHDCPPPASVFEPLPPWVGTTAFTVTWAGQETWAGIATYDVQARDGYEGTWTDCLTDTTATSATFTGVNGHTYFFRARARAPYGNQEPYGNAEWGQTFTTVLTESAPVLVTSRKLATPWLFRPDQTITYTVLISNTGNLTATVALTDTAPASMVVLTETLVAPPGLTLVYPDDSIHWTGVVTPGSEVRVSYVLSPTAATPTGAPLTNTVEIAGSVLGTFARRETVVQAYLIWSPLIMRSL